LIRRDGYCEDSIGFQKRAQSVQESNVPAYVLDDIE
jgi:hypothetical protein